jgi:hypothetical protein
MPFSREGMVCDSRGSGASYHDYCTNRRVRVSKCLLDNVVILTTHPASLC